MSADDSESEDWDRLIQCDVHGPALSMIVCIHIHHHSVPPEEVIVADYCAYCQQCERKGPENLSVDDLTTWCADHFRAWMSGEE